MQRMDNGAAMRLPNDVGPHATICRVSVFDETPPEGPAVSRTPLIVGGFLVLVVAGAAISI